MDELRAKHRKELRDLQGKITQKKKAATKKSRKGVNDECETLERELKQRQEQEIVELTGDSTKEDAEISDSEKSENRDLTEGVTQSIKDLAVSESGTTDKQEAPGQKKPNRQKARLARRAAEQAALADQAAAEAANLPDLREQERKRMSEHLSKHGLKEKEIRADGHCLYSAVADQMKQLGPDLLPKVSSRIINESTEVKDEASSPDYKAVRAAAADYINVNRDEFAPFLEEPLPMYVHKIRDTGEWGGHMGLLALAKTYGIAINVLHGDGRIDKVEPGTGDMEGDQSIWLGYYRHGFGLGEHYNSLRKAP